MMILGGRALRKGRASASEGPEPAPRIVEEPTVELDEDGMPIVAEEGEADAEAETTGDEGGDAGEDEG